MAPVVVNYVPPPIWAAVLVVQRDARAPFTPFADHLLQSNAERRRYPDRERSWSLRHVD